MRRRKRGGGTIKEWTYKVYARNGRCIAKAEESFKQAKYALTRALQSYPGYPIWKLDERRAVAALGRHLIERGPVALQATGDRGVGYRKLSSKFALGGAKGGTPGLFFVAVSFLRSSIFRAHRL